MTIAPAVTATSYAIGGGASLGPFATVWPFEDADDIAVWLYGVAGPPALLTLGTDYTVSAPSPLTGGGNVTLASAVLATYGTTTPGQWNAGAQVVLCRQTSADQPTSFSALGEFDPTLFEAALDHIDRQVQEIDTTVGARAVLAPPGDSLTDLPVAALRENMLLGFDGAGNPACTLSVTNIAGVPVIQGPAGAAGAQGIQGVPGIQGNPGAGALGYTPLNIAGHGAASGDMTGELVVPSAVTPTSAWSVGLRGLPVNEQDANYTLALTDAGQAVRCNAAGAVTYILRKHATLAWPAGSMIVFRNVGAGALTIQPDAGVTCLLPGAATSGPVVIAQWGLVTAWLEAADTWIFSGSGASN